MQVLENELLFIGSLHPWRYRVFFNWDPPKKSHLPPPEKWNIVSKADVGMQHRGYTNMRDLSHRVVQSILALMQFKLIWNTSSPRTRGAATACTGHHCWHCTACLQLNVNGNQHWSAKELCACDNKKSPTELSNQCWRCYSFYQISFFNLRHWSQFPAPGIDAQVVVLSTFPLRSPASAAMRTPPKAQCSLW